MPIKDKEKNAIYNRNYRNKKRQLVIDKLGGVCVICGFSDIRALQIDHINGGGHKKKIEKDHQISLYHEVLKDDGSTYQLLCANCNWIKRAENNEIGNKWMNRG